MAPTQDTARDGVDERPAEGERSAVVGFSGQYGLAARIVRAKITTLRWIRVADPDAGVADDFQFEAAGTRYALQVKWAQYPGSFGWAELANAPKGSTPLFGRLAQAWQRIRETWSGPLEIRLWSNENASNTSPRAGSALGSCSAVMPRHFAAFLARAWTPVQERLRDGGGDWSKIAALPEFTDWQPAWDALRTATGLSHNAFAAFIGDMHLHFGPAVDDRLLRPDEAPRDGDLEHLAATLQALVADPARPTQLTREELLERLGWSDRLHYRNRHSFPVPAIYTANEAARRRLHERLDALTGGYVALVGPAGAGKSTLLASLAWPQRRVVRYYAFVPDASDPLSGRGEADSFLHDVSLALEEAGLPRHGNGNDLRTQRAVLQEQLTEAGERWRRGDEATVIVVDGLDHIPREQNPSRSLLEELPLAPPEGVFFVLGTQTVDILPRSLREALDVEDRTVELPPLSLREVLALADAAGPGAWLLPGQREDLVTASEGHPLALTYLLQDLAALEAAEVDAHARGAAADALLRDASRYGREVAARYRGYMLAIGDDPDLHKLVAAVARLRAPVDLDWLKTWVTAPVLEVFVRTAQTFFRRDGTVWRFIHNSFRRFLIEETAKIAGRFDADRDRELYVALADACERSDEQWALYRDEELTHRYLAGDYAQVIERATPDLLREKILALRPLAVVRDQARVALRAAAETGDRRALVRMLLFHNELWQREYVVSAEQLADVMVDVGPPERALEHVVAAGRLRVPVGAALKIAARFARSGMSEAATQIVRAAGSLAEIVAIDSRNAAEWSEVTFHISGLNEVLAQVDDQLLLPEKWPANDDMSTAADDGTDRAAERRRRDQEDRIDQILSARDLLLARCFDLSSEIRDEAQLAILRDRIDRESPLDWRARARVVQAKAGLEDGDTSVVLRSIHEIIELHSSDRDDDLDGEDGSAARGEGGVPLVLRLAAADLLVDTGLLDAPELDRLVQPDTTVAWPSGPFRTEGLRPFQTYIDLARLRVVRPASSFASPAAPPAGPSRLREAGTERFRRALTTMAQLEGRQTAARMGRGNAPHVAAEADPIIRLLEVPRSETRHWTTWYYIQNAAPELFQRLAQLAADCGPQDLSDLLDRFSAAWDDPHRAEFWSPQRQLWVLQAVLPDATAEVVAGIRCHLDRLEAAIMALAIGPHEQADVCLELAKAWSKAEDLPRAEQAVQSALRAAWGPGYHDDDRQLAAWLDWMRAAADAAVLDRDQFLSNARDYVGRLAAANDADGDVAEAASKLIEMVWSVDPALSTTIAESLCDAGVISEGDAVEAVLLGAGRDQMVPVDLVATSVAELHMPLRKRSSGRLRGAIEQRLEPQAQRALSIIDDAIAVWSVPEDVGGSDARHTDGEGFGAESPAPDGVDAAATLPVSVTALLTQMRRAGDLTTEPRDWAAAVDTVTDESVTPAVAAALLYEASRLRLDGEALGGIVAIAARAGQSEAAAAVAADALARTPAHGWLYRYDGGSRLKLLHAALRHRDSTIARLAARDLAGALATGALSGQLHPEDLRRILETIDGDDAVARAWPEIAEYLDAYAPATRVIPGLDEVVAPARSPLEALLRWVTGFFGHPVRARDFGARRTLHAGLDMGRAEAESVLGECIGLGGWQMEAALHTLLTYNAPGFSPSASLGETIMAAALADDAICRALARRLCDRHGLTAPTPPPRAMANTYELVLPSLPARVPPELDQRGVPIIDMNDPQQIVAPFDRCLRFVASIVDLSEEAVLYRAATVALALDMPWLRGGHQAHAVRLQVRGSEHVYRPWALMSGRRALGIVLAELLDAGMGELGTASELSNNLGLVDEVLSRVVPQPLDETTPAPWRAPTEAHYDTRGWCEHTSEAAQAYATASATTSPYVLAEHTDWVRLEWGKPEETRMVLTSHGPADVGGVMLLPRRRWERSSMPANDYPALQSLEWTGEPLIVQGMEEYSDSPWHSWLALHPAAGRHLGWEHEPNETFGWRGRDGAWRARSIFRARGQLSHRPPSRAFCAEGWQVVLSGAGLAEMCEVLGPLRRVLSVERTLPARPREGRPSAENRRVRVSLTEPA